MITLILFFTECWSILVESSPFMLLGLSMAGLTSVFIDARNIVVYLGKGRIKSALYTALIGIPLPLCSCATLPAAIGLKKRGATDGAAISFLIATPQTGIDSIAVTYALMDPIMTAFRPIAAFVTAVFAGIAQNYVGGTYRESKDITPTPACQNGCNHENEAVVGNGLKPSPTNECCCNHEVESAEKTISPNGALNKTLEALRYGFGELLGDIALWFLLGAAVAALIQVFLPDNWAESVSEGKNIFAMFAALIVSVPLYICASASTPIAAALMLKGLSPGAALVFLLAGPATNMASIAVVYGALGKRAAIIYLSSIVIFSMLAGLLLDWLYDTLGVTPIATIGKADELLPLWFSELCAVIFLALALFSVYKRCIESKINRWSR